MGALGYKIFEPLITHENENQKKKFLVKNRFIFQNGKSRSYREKNIRRLCCSRRK